MAALAIARVDGSGMGVCVAEAVSLQLRNFKEVESAVDLKVTSKESSCPALPWAMVPDVSKLEPGLNGPGKLKKGNGLPTPSPGDRTSRVQKCPADVHNILSVLGEG